jgi:TDG/mug DNA glycosylase family protein
MTRVFSLEPVIPDEPAILILGSMPGQRSLEMGQYYAHPQNLFWKIMGKLIGFEPGLSYEQRLDALKTAGISLWDVLKSCEREGSMDGSIKLTSELPNDLVGLFQNHPSIKVIAFNGNKSWNSFQKHIFPILDEMKINKFELMPMPSTSPANARLTFEVKLDSWGKISRYLNR